MSNSNPSLLHKYVRQLNADIHECANNVDWPYLDTNEISLEDWKSEEEEDATAPVRNLTAWTGIRQEMLPPESMLTDEEVSVLLSSLTNLLSNLNCHAVFQVEVPDRVQYETIRQNFNQDVKVREWHYGFFEFCQPGTPLRACVLGEYCHCEFYQKLAENFVEENVSPEESRRRQLEIEINYLKRKYDADWMKYYPFHLDKDFDDESDDAFDEFDDNGQEDEGWD
jgi:hypothetical protein